MKRIWRTLLAFELCAFFAVSVYGQTQRAITVRPTEPSTTLSMPSEPDSPGTSSTPAADTREAVPRLMKFSGTLHGATGKPLSGTADVTFALYSTESGGNPLWFETQSLQADDLGRYTVLLGAMHTDGLPIDLFTSGEVRWLGIQVGLEAEQPRVLLVSVPYALKAGDAETLGGKPASAYMLSDAQSMSATGPTTIPATGGAQIGTGGTTQKSRTANITPLTAACPGISSNIGGVKYSVPRFTSTCNLETSIITQLGNNVGIGTASPAYTLDITGPSNAGLRLSGAGSHQVTITGATSGRLGQDAAGFFFASDTNAAALRFLTNNGALNEWMRINSAGNVGIGTSVPVTKLEVLAPGTTSSNLIIPGDGVAGECSVTSCAGIDGISSGPAGYGIYAHSTSADGTAAVLDGLVHVTRDLHVDGAITAGTKDFKIDHPLDPEGKYLYHASVESSEMMNLYTGNVTTNGNGDAEVELPAWFQAVNQDFRYQLTVIGQFAQAIVSREIENNHFTIKTDKANVKVSWQVTGVRHDPFANSHPLQVEEVKPAAEQGTYLHPRAYGQPEKKRVEWSLYKERHQVPKTAQPAAGIIPKVGI